MKNKNRPLDPQTTAMAAAMQSAQRIGEEAAARHQAALEQAAQHSQNVVQVAHAQGTENLSQAQINSLVRASPSDLAKALRNISRG